MAKPTDHTLEDADPTIGEFAVPDKASLGWSPAEHVFVHLDGQEMMVGDFYAPLTGREEEASVIEFTATDIPVGSLLVDIDGYDSEAFDLNELLSESEIAPALTLVTTPDEADSAQSASMDAPQMSTDLAFPPLAIVIDDESGSDTVAL